MRFNQAIADAKERPTEIILTVTGNLRTQSGAPYKGKDGRMYKARMFGHLGAFRAELLVEKLDKIEISTNSQRPSYFGLAKPKNNSSIKRGD